MNVGIIGIIGAAIVVVVIFIVLSPKTMEKTLTKMSKIAINAQKNVLDENEEDLRNISNKSADINSDAIKTVAHSIKEGFTQNDTVYCKYCGAVIDSDSKFCKKCGKEQ